MQLSYLEVSAKALHHNGNMITRYVNCPVIGVLKCNGYGASLLAAARAWQDCGATMFAVSDPADALALRDAGFLEDILLLSPVCDPYNFGRMCDAHVILPITSTQIAELYARFCTTEIIRVHVAVDTGMGRFGVRWTKKNEIRKIYDMPCFRVEGIYSHFSSAFEKRYSKTKMQLHRFLSVTEYLADCGISVGMRHIANSCAALRFQETRLDAVRIGSALVGRLCIKPPIELQAVGQLCGQVLDVKELLPGDSVGYGGISKVHRKCRVAIVALGMENGLGYCKDTQNYPLRCMPLYFRRRLMERKSALSVSFGGYILPLVGRIGTQFSLFNASGVPIKPGDYVSCKANMLFPHNKRRLI